MIAIINRGQPAFAHYYSGLILVTMWNYTLLRLRFFYATLTTLLLVIAYEITAIVFQGMLNGGIAGPDFPTFLINNFFLLSVIVISILIGYTIETYMRTDFQQRQDLRKAYEDLKQSQAHLVQAEKEASLGQLVAGVAHEINTPVGIGVTAVSHFAELTKDITKAFEQRTATKQDMEKYFRVVQQDSDLILMNLIRTSELVKSFKMVAADQTSGERREFNVKSYIEYIILSLRPKLKKTSIQVSVDCPADLVMDSYPGALAQIFTNFVINSLMHAYEPDAEGRISIAVERNGDHAVFTYRDDGKGIPRENLNKIFDPFFTTSRGSGGTGLGLSVVSNLVTQMLKGSLHCDSILGQGVAFTIKTPLSLRVRERAGAPHEEVK
ncbi:MAG: HAMP domain-containing histidine kinase [Nitrospinae bacterium]|nr:HAMP domain-containing histidine kinase [Nitrospinota bacterium]